MPRAFWSCNKSIESAGNQNIFSSDQPLTELIWMSEYLEKSLAPCLNEAIKQERCHSKGSHLLLWDLLLHGRWQRAAAAEAEAAVAWNTKKHITSIHPLRYLTERLTMPLPLSLSLSSVGVRTSLSSDCISDSEWVAVVSDKGVQFWFWRVDFQTNKRWYCL